MDRGRDIFKYTSTARTCYFAILGRTWGGGGGRASPSRSPPNCHRAQQRRTESLKMSKTIHEFGFPGTNVSITYQQLQANPARRFHRDLQDSVSRRSPVLINLSSWNDAIYLPPDQPTQGSRRDSDNMLGIRAAAFGQYRTAMPAEAMYVYCFISKYEK